jgi:hypothetical protein
MLQPLPIPGFTMNRYVGMVLRGGFVDDGCNPCFVGLLDVFLPNIPTKLENIMYVHIHQWPANKPKCLFLDPGFESRQGVRFLGIYTLQCCCHNLISLCVLEKSKCLNF